MNYEFFGYWLLIVISPLSLVFAKVLKEIDMLVV